jgi:rubrerythrin
MTLEEAIQTAIEYETKVRDVYKAALGKSADSVGKRVIQVLADEEQGHVTYLQHILEEWKSKGAIHPKKLKTAIPTKEAILANVKKLKEQMPTGKVNKESEMEILKKALQVETETSDFYRRMVNELTAEGQQLFSHFVEIENGHLAIVQAEMDSVDKMGYWFDMREFDLEAG